MESSLASTYQLIRIGNIGRKIVKTLLKTFTNDAFTPVILDNVRGDIKVSEYFKQVQAKDALVRKWLMWFNAQFGGEMDCILCPASSVPPPVKGSVAEITPAIVYTSLWNVLGNCRRSGGFSRRLADLGSLGRLDRWNRSGDPR